MKPMKNFKISKRFTFDAAHVLVKGYVGKCANLHGHTWTVEVTAIVPENCLNKYDMGIDFSNLKSIAEAVKMRFDHMVILCDSDEDNIERMKHRHNVSLVRGNPTVEVLCKEIYAMAWEVLGHENPIHDFTIAIWETPDSMCTYG